MADGVLEVYILIRVGTDASDRVANRLKQNGFNARITVGLNSPCDIIIFFDAKNEKIEDLRSRIQRINGVSTVCILSAFPV